MDKLTSAVVIHQGSVLAHILADCISEYLPAKQKKKVHREVIHAVDEMWTQEFEESKDRISSPAQIEILEEIGRTALSAARNTMREFEGKSNG